MDPGTAVARADKHAWELEAEAGEPEVPPLSERPGTIVAADEVSADEFGAGGDVQSFCRDLGEAVGSVRTGLNIVSVPPGKLGAPPHCHSAEEELFVVLEGDGTLLLGEDEHPVLVISAKEIVEILASRGLQTPDDVSKWLAAEFP